MPQFRAGDSDDGPTPLPGPPVAVPQPDRDNPIELLRDAIARLKTSGGVPDQAQVANLLAEAREALEHANVVAGALAQCAPLLEESLFDKAYEPLDAALLVYPGDPALLARRHEVESRQKAFETAAAVRAALEEAGWFLDQNRLDLAVEFLKEKSTVIPDQRPLLDRLEELEARLPQWRQKRDVHDALTRVATLEQVEQWQAALTVLEEALQSYPASQDLGAAARRVRDRLTDHERERRLARRLEQIRHQIAANSWKQALALVEKTEREFPGAFGLAPLQAEVEAGLRRSECEALVTEVRQYLADGELEQAGQALRRGRKALGSDPTLDTLSAELETERRYQEDLRSAQVLFGRRKLQEAEQILNRLSTQNRPEALALLQAVREARAATEEENFFERGRGKALDLMRQQQFVQAADLLRNLLSLYPGNPILERDLATAQSAIKPEPSLPVEPAILEAAPPPAASPEAAPFRPSATTLFSESRSGIRMIALVAVAAWKISHRRAVARPSPVSAASLAQPQLLPAPLPDAAGQPPADAPTRAPGPSAAAPAASKAQPIFSIATPLRQFVPPASQQAAAQDATSALPVPPGAGPVTATQTVVGYPADFARAIYPPAPPPAPANSSPPAAAPPAQQAKPPVVIGGKMVEAQILSRVTPDYPIMARQRGLYGAVRMEASIDEHGDVKSVKVLAGDPILTAAAKTAVMQWKYKPATLNGKPIATVSVIQIVFGEPGK